MHVEFTVGESNLKFSVNISEVLFNFRNSEIKFLCICRAGIYISFYIRILSSTIIKGS